MIDSYLFVFYKVTSVLSPIHIEKELIKLVKQVSLLLQLLILRIYILSVNRFISYSTWNQPIFLKSNNEQ